MLTLLVKTESTANTERESLKLIPLFKVNNFNIYNNKMLEHFATADRAFKEYSWCFFSVSYYNFFFFSVHQTSVIDVGDNIFRAPVTADGFSVRGFKSRSW